MADVVSVLTSRRTSLAARKREIKVEADRRIAEIDAEIYEINKAINIVNDAVKPYLCKACGGSGSVRRLDAAGSSEDWPCSKCKGIGVARE